MKNKLTNKHLTTTKHQEIPDLKKTEKIMAIKSKVKKNWVEKLWLKIPIKISEKETDMKILPNQLLVEPVLTIPMIDNRVVKDTIP